MTSWKSTLVNKLLLICLFTLPAAYAAKAPEPPKAPSAEALAELERAAQAAGERLAEAARAFAELQKELHGSGCKDCKGDRAMLGILFDADGRKDGVRLVGVTPGSGAQEAGLQSGDVVIAIDGKDMQGGEAPPLKILSRYMDEVTPGDVVVLKVRRDGEEFDKEIKTTARGQHMLSTLEKEMHYQFDDAGMKTMIMRDIVAPVDDHAFSRLFHVSGDLAEYFDVKSGVVVIAPPKDSELRAGDVLLEIDGEEVGDDVKNVVAMLSAVDEPTRVRIKRHGDKQNVTVQPEAFASGGVKIIRVEKISDDDNVEVEIHTSSDGDNSND